MPIFTWKGMISSSMHLTQFSRCPVRTWYCLSSKNIAVSSCDWFDCPSTPSPCPLPKSGRGTVAHPFTSSAAQQLRPLRAPFPVSPLSGELERCLASRAPQGDIGAGFDQELHDPEVPAPRRQVNRRVAAVHDVDEGVIL